MHLAEDFFAKKSQIARNIAALSLTGANRPVWQRLSSLFYDFRIRPESREEICNSLHLTKQT
jgi:hypothetical protein